MNRSEHCTHPNQEFCDCDWCRLVRADETKRQTISKLLSWRHTMKEAGLIAGTDTAWADADSAIR